MKKLLFSILFLFLSWAVLAQNRTVTGVVVDERDTPMAGATLVAGKAYAVADGKGRFSLQAPQDAVVTVSFLGYDDYLFTVKGNANMTIRMNPSAATLLNESVAIGYGKTTKKEVTGAVVSLK